MDREKTKRKHSGDDFEENVKKPNHRAIDANQIASICLEAYRSLGKSGKPNQETEHTVLASLVEYHCGCHHDDQDPHVVAISTGTTVMPRNILNRREDIVDCHAESLLKRSFQRYLIEIIGEWIEVNGQKLVVDPHFLYNSFFSCRRYCLFVSQHPCGCVSRWKGDDIDPNESNPNQTGSDFKQFKKIGVNRKPGRGDLCPKAGCIHKIAKWQALGLQGSKLFKFLPKPLTFDRLVIGNCEIEPGLFFLNELCERILIPKDELHLVQPTKSYELSQSIEFAESFRIEEFIGSSGEKMKKRPAGSSIAAWLGIVPNGIETKISPCLLRSEVLANGRKLGAKKRKTEIRADVDRNVCQETLPDQKLSTDLSKLCDVYIVQDVRRLNDRLKQLSSNQNDWKNFLEKTDEFSNAYYQNWNIVKNQLSLFKGWPPID